MTRTIKLGINRGKPRLWLEGAWLVEFGFVRGARFVSTLTDNGLRLMIVADGSDQRARTVSGKDKANGTPHPIIDMNGAELALLAGVPLTLTAEKGLLTIRKA